MAKKKSKDGYDPDDVKLDDGSEEEKSNPFVNFLIVVVIVAIWLVIFALLIKMNVGGIGSMLRPYLKNIPVINMILPEASDEEVMEESGYNFKNLAEAVERIKELEAELDSYKNSGTASQETISQLQAEIERLKVFEANQLYYQELKEKFDNEVVYTDNAPDLEEYKKWYEEMDPENAAKIYADVVEQLNYSKKVKEWAETYAKMDADKAAAILEEMTGDTDLVADILLCMTSKQRADVMAAMDPVYAAKLTKIMYP